MADLRIVCDTNVYIAAALRGGQAEAVMQLAAAGVITLVVSPTILAELDEKLRDKFDWTQEQAQLFLETVRMVAEVVEPAITLNVVEEDPDDNRILEFAQAGQVALVVTYDKHLLRLKQYELIGIIHPQDLLHFGLTVIAGTPLSRADVGQRGLQEGRTTMSEIFLTIQIEPLEEGGYLATSNDLQGLVAQGRTVAETMEIAQDVARKLLESYLEHGDPLPPKVRAALKQQRRKTMAKIPIGISLEVSEA